MSVRTVLSTVTLVLLAIVLFSARHSLVHAWRLLGQVNILILLLVVPIVMISYLASGEMIFSYLRQKKLIKHVNPFSLMRISLELNFVNHILPSGGASGVAYFNWRMNKIGVPVARATMAQAVRYVAGFIATTVMLGVALVAVTMDGTVNRLIILMSALLVILMMSATFALYFLVSNRRRAEKIASWITRVANAATRKVTLGAKTGVLNFNTVNGYFGELHDDYVELSRDKKLLIQPILWGIVYVAMDIAMFWVTFIALGTYVNPATILIAYHLATLAGFIVVTPGGVGAYEAVMVMIVVASGIARADAIAGVVLARVIILLVTILIGYIFYQEALLRYGKQLKPNTAP